MVNKLSSWKCFGADQHQETKCISCISVVAALGTLCGAFVQRLSGHSAMEMKGANSSKCSRASHVLQGLVTEVLVEVVCLVGRSGFLKQRWIVNKWRFLWLE